MADKAALPEDESQQMKPLCPEQRHRAYDDDGALAYGHQESHSRTLTWGTALSGMLQPA